MSANNLPRCSTCAYWMTWAQRYPHRQRPTHERGGYCLSRKIVEAGEEVQADDMLVYSYSEGGDFWTGPDFGCVHHANKAAK